MTKQEKDKAILENAPDECTHSRPDKDYQYDNLGFVLRDLSDIRELVALRDEVAEKDKRIEELKQLLDMAFVMDVDDYESTYPVKWLANKLMSKRR